MARSPTMLAVMEEACTVAVAPVFTITPLPWLVMEPLRKSSMLPTLPARIPSPLAFTLTPRALMWPPLLANKPWSLARTVEVTELPVRLISPPCASTPIALAPVA
ncbi:hypothetical protein D3C80_1310670 [compost metagenome]